jgi:hypothetical protein
MVSYGKSFSYIFEQLTTAAAVQLSKTSSGNKRALYFASSFEIEKFIDVEQSKPTQNYYFSPILFSTNI